MLALERWLNQSIMIGDDIEIMIVEIRGGKVRLGITAPQHIPVHRKEVYERIRLRNQKAVKPAVAQK